MTNPVPTQQAPPERVFISFSAEINANTTESLIAAMAQCANQNVPEVHLLLSTPGGMVMNGMNLYNVLKAMPFTLITHNVGNVDSIGNAIFLAGERRLACKHSTFMFHGVAFGTPGPTNLDEKALRENLGSVGAGPKEDCFRYRRADHTYRGTDQAPLSRSPDQGRCIRR
ncbi:MAG TPA: ATP-dependent Clp protease proteolytic subunit [Acidimicrobiales bacterium]|nr:ATP-dependent Clp protease proteolytic subunit [Acidimicrobiales bacterium]